MLLFVSGSFRPDGKVTFAELIVSAACAVAAESNSNMGGSHRRAAAGTCRAKVILCLRMIVSFG